MTVWHWLDARGVPGFVLSGWIGALPALIWGYLVTERRHKEKLAVMRETRSDQ